ncbi:hypothetical protein C8Q74DRAFT_321688 [Fomes fomentarius]|nr:hypothetical protein C8Q74DRAFT_321688 [Fomes fomentarius]
MYNDDDEPWDQDGNTPAPVSDHAWNMLDWMLTLFEATMERTGQGMSDPPPTGESEYPTLGHRDAVRRRIPCTRTRRRVAAIAGPPTVRSSHQPGVNDPPRFSHVPECCIQSCFIAVYAHTLLPSRMVTRHPDCCAVQGLLSGHALEDHSQPAADYGRNSKPVRAHSGKGTSTEYLAVGGVDASKDMEGTSGRQHRMRAPRSQASRHPTS